MFDIFKCYCGISLPQDPVSVAKKVLSCNYDKTLQELFWFFLALHADEVDGRDIYKKLDGSLRQKFRDAYNRAFLLLEIWATLIKMFLGRRLILPNLFLDKYCEKHPYHIYKTIFGKEIKRIERRWKEIVNLYSIRER